MLLSAAVAPNGRMVATGSQDRTLKLWSAEDGRLQGVCRGHKRGVWSVAFSPVDKVLVAFSPIVTSENSLPQLHRNLV